MTWIILGTTTRKSLHRSEPLIYADIYITALKYLLPDIYISTVSLTFNMLLFLLEFNTCIQQECNNAQHVVNIDNKCFLSSNSAY